MRKRSLRYPVALAALLALLTLSLPALAKGADLTVTAEPAALTEGETVTLTVRLEGDGLSVAQGTFVYDPYMLTFSGGEGGVSDGFLNLVSAEKGGSSALVATLTFTARRDGEAKIDFSFNSVLTYGGDDVTPDAAAVTLAIAPAPEAAATPQPPQTDYSSGEVSAPALNVEGAAGEMFIWRSLENVTLPSKYTPIDYLYHGEAVAAAAVPDSDAPLLLYLTDALGDNGGYYIYDEASDLLYRYSTLTSVQKSYILMRIPADVTAPEGFTPGSLTIGSSEIPAYIGSDDLGSIYLIYARNPAGETGFYMYDPDDRSLQRYKVYPARPSRPEDYSQPSATAAPDALTPSPAAPQAPACNCEGDGITLSRPLFYAMCAVLCALAIALVTLTVSRAVENAHRKKRAIERKAAREASAAPKE